MLMVMGGVLIFPRVANKASIIGKRLNVRTIIIIRPIMKGILRSKKFGKPMMPLRKPKMFVNI